MWQQDLTTGNITTKLWAFALPLMLGNVLQQFYNLADTWIVAKFIGEDALAAVGSSYTLMTFLTSVILGLCLGSSAFASIVFGQRDEKRLRNGIFLSFLMIGLLTALLTVLAYGLLDWIILVLQIPSELYEMTHCYLFYVFMGLPATFLYNYFANLLRGIGNSFIPLVFLAVSVGLNIVLDIVFVFGSAMGIKGAAIATIIAQAISGIGVMAYAYFAYPSLRIHKTDCNWDFAVIKELLSLSGFTCIQQSVMNFGILTVQGIVNGFGSLVMSAFAGAVKIDTIAYMPLQDFGNAFSTFIAQNYGAKKTQRIQAGIKKSLLSVTVFSLFTSLLVCIFAPQLMGIFTDTTKSELIRIGVVYLRIEGIFYIGIGILFMLYGYYRAIRNPKISVILTVLSLGTRVLLAYVLSRIEAIGVIGIWAAIPIGWFLADAFGIWYYCKGSSEGKTMVEL